ncbi:DUF6635 family protein [Celeribacter sp.]|uniref:DUF6635 family protein n=1 Tax=Celeribacter sp. TaxID=1890673 RepID=UPI003A8CE54B
MPQPLNNNVRDVRQRVDAFVRTHFNVVGTLRLHREALGWDLLRAPVNVVLAPLYLLLKLTGAVAQRLGFHSISNALKKRQVFLKTAVARRIETHIATDLLENASLTPRSRALIDQYTSTRSAVAEITTSLLVLLAGLVLFGTATPGIASLTPKMSGFVAHAAAVADFPLGTRLGSLWYGVFPVALPVWFVIGTGVVLAMIASIVTTFAGIIADPIQSRLGIHRRRLLRLLDKISAVEGHTSDLAPEHILARLADLTDAGISLLRAFRS